MVFPEFLYNKIEFLYSFKDFLLLNIGSESFITFVYNYVES